MTDNTRQSPDELDAKVLLGQQTVLEIQHEGKSAALAGQPVNDCPWTEPGNDIDQARQTMWIRGYAMGRTELRRRASPQR